jgi:hypothetical protein
MAWQGLATDLRAVSSSLDANGVLVRQATTEEKARVEDLSERFAALDREYYRNAQLQQAGAYVEVRHWTQVLAYLAWTGSEAFVSQLEPGLERILAAIDATRIDTRTGAVTLDAKAWARAREARLHDLENLPLRWSPDRWNTGDGDGIDDVGALKMIALARSGKVVPLPTFARIGWASIGGQFVARITPLGLILRQDPKDPEHWDPVGFLRHDLNHSEEWVDHLRTTVGEFLASEAPAIFKAYPRFLAKNRPEAARVGEQIHEHYASPFDAPDYTAAWKKARRELETSPSISEVLETSPSILRQAGASLSDTVERARARGERHGGASSIGIVESLARDRAELPTVKER